MSENINADKVECRRLVVKHPESEHLIEMTGLPKGAYLWVSGPEGTVTVGTQEDRTPFICLYRKNTTLPAIAISADQHGYPLIQLVDPMTGTISFIEYADLEKVAAGKAV